MSTYTIEFNKIEGDVSVIVNGIQAWDSKNTPPPQGHLTVVDITHNLNIGPNLVQIDCSKQAAQLMDPNFSFDYVIRSGPEVLAAIRQNSPSRASNHPASGYLKAASTLEIIRN
ncbi:MAG: hypothetical protein AAF570_05685 [Bacteroidota bacterium]